MGMGILATTVGALMSGLTYGFFTMKIARENLRATQIMLEKVETIRLYSWDQINTPGFIPTNFVAYYDPNSPDNPGQTYYGTLTITNSNISASYADDLKLVTVTISWQTGGLTRTREFKSFISRYGLQDYVY